MGQQRGPGAPRRNQNARKPPGERKQYKQLFGQRFEIAEAEKVEAFLDENQLTQSEWLRQHLLPLVRQHHEE